MNTAISDAALPVVARYVGRTSNIYRYIAEDMAVVDAQIADEAKKPEAVRLRDELRERAEFEAWARGIGACVDADEHGNYVDAHLNSAKLGWEAALAATGKQQVGETESVDDDWHLRGYAYASKQATTCAGCGKHKHTPLRIDAMGGYVCLTCIDQKLGTLLDEFGHQSEQVGEVQGDGLGRWRNGSSVALANSRAFRVYIAGPMTGYEDYNFPAFNAAAEMLCNDGFTPVNPADHGIVEGAGWADYLRDDIAKIATCEAIYFLPGWSKSKGATLEHHIAGALGMEMRFADGAERQPVGE